MLGQFLRTAADHGWSGSIHVGHNGELLGQVIFVDGQVAWAVCKAQTETLGTFLARLGYVTPRQLDVVQSIFKAHRGGKKLGAILEECGFTSRAVLRRGLQLHTRAAIQTLAQLPDARIVQVPGEPGRDEEVLFRLEEVLPEEAAVDEPRAWRLWQDIGPENQILEPLMGVPGYVGAAIASAEGGLLTAHVATPDVDPMAIAAHLAGVLERTDGPGVFARPETLFLHAGEHWVVSRTVDEERNRFVVVFGTGPARPEIVSFVIDDCLAELRSWLATAGGGDRFRDLLRTMVQKSDSAEDALEAVEMALRERLRQARARRAPPDQLERYQSALDLVRQRDLEAAVRLLA